jgi:predicted anti-sigma-YlaC factor YlaD
MNCTEFRREYGLQLDAHRQEITDPALADHLRSCSDCRIHVESMQKIDAALRNPAGVVIPQGLAERLAAIPAEHPGLSESLIRMRWFFPGVVALIAIVTLLIATLFGSPEVRFIIRTLAVAGALVYAMLRMGLLSGSNRVR